MLVRAVRGAITVEENSSESVISSTRALLEKIVEENRLEEDNIISVIFTATADLNSAFPAAAARELGWKHVPLMCAVEINVDGSLEKCVRIMMHVYTDKSPQQIKHVYLKGAKVLRPDIAGK